MALVIMDGFDHIASSQATLKGWSRNPSSMVAGRFGGQAARLNGVSLGKAVPSAATYIFGFAMRSNINIGTAFNDIFDTSPIPAVGGFVSRLSINTNGQIDVKNNANTVIATTSTVFTTNVWFYIELKIFVNGASGTCELHVNGVTDISSTIGNFGSSNIVSIAWNAGSASVNYDVDDIYVLDTTGSAPRNTFLGESRVATIMPTGAGAHTDWTPNASTNFSRVNETTPDDDTSYISDSTSGHIDTYTFADIDTAATVYGVQSNLYARKDDAATRQIAPVIRQSGTDYVGSTVTLGSSYLCYSQIYNQDPTAADWTPTSVNADEFGVKVI